MIMAWSWNSIRLEINDMCMFLTIATNMRDAIHQTYLKALDVTLAYKIKVKIGAIKQGNKTITKSTNMLKIL